MYLPGVKEPYSNHFDSKVETDGHTKKLSSFINMKSLNRHYSAQMISIQQTPLSLLKRPVRSDTSLDRKTKLYSQIDSMEKTFITPVVPLKPALCFSAGVHASTLPSNPQPCSNVPSTHDRHLSNAETVHNGLLPSLKTNKQTKLYSTKLSCPKPVFRDIFTDTKHTSCTVTNVSSTKSSVGCRALESIRGSCSETGVSPIKYCLPKYLETVTNEDNGSILFEKSNVLSSRTSYPKPTFESSRFTYVNDLEKDTKRQASKLQIFPNTYVTWCQTSDHSSTTKKVQPKALSESCPATVIVKPKPDFNSSRKSPKSKPAFNSSRKIPNPKPDINSSRKSPNPKPEAVSSTISDKRRSYIDSLCALYKQVPDLISPTRNSKANLQVTAKIHNDKRVETVCFKTHERKPDITSSVESPVPNVQDLFETESHKRIVTVCATKERTTDVTSCRGNPAVSRQDNSDIHNNKPAKTDSRPPKRKLDPASLTMNRLPKHQIVVERVIHDIVSGAVTAPPDQQSDEFSSFSESSIDSLRISPLFFFDNFSSSSSEESDEETAILPEVYKAASQSKEKKSILPLIKEELKSKIQLKRLSEGKEEMKVDFTPSLFQVITCFMTHAPRNIITADAIVCFHIV